MDRNRHKRICFDRAEAAGVAHARLPIQKHLALNTSAVRALPRGRLQAIGVHACGCELRPAWLAGS